MDKTGQDCRDQRGFKRWNGVIISDCTIWLTDIINSHHNFVVKRMTKIKRARKKKEKQEEGEQGAGRRSRGAGRLGGGEGGSRKGRRRRGKRRNRR